LLPPNLKEAVMKTLIAVVALAVGMGACAALPAAEEKAQQKAGGGLAARVQDLHLTDAQEAKIADIRKEFKPRMQEAARNLAALVKEEEEKVLGVLTAGQREKLRNAKEELKEMRAESLAEQIAHLGELNLTDSELTQIAAIRKEYRPKFDQTLNELEGLLTDDQKKARQDAIQAGKRGRVATEALKLSNEVKEKVHAVGKKAASLFHEEMGRIRDVLHMGQKKQLQEVKAETREHVRDRQAYRIANLKDLNLTEAQKTRIADIRREFLPRVHEAGNRLRATVREEAEAILAVIKG
jgi:Spy/CpxP family protein refolding chaperone